MPNTVRSRSAGTAGFVTNGLSSLLSVGADTLAMENASRRKVVVGPLHEGAMVTL